MYKNKLKISTQESVQNYCKEKVLVILCRELRKRGKNMEKEEKSKSNVALIVIIVILLIAVAGLCGYIFLNMNGVNNTEQIAESNTANLQSTNTQQYNSANNNIANTTNTTSTEMASTAMFDPTKSLNTTGVYYTLSDTSSGGVYASVDSTQKVLTFSFTLSEVVKHYGLSWKSNKSTVESSEIKFDKKIVEVLFGGMGQDVSGETLLILLEDGTVEYIPVIHMFENSQDVPSSTYGKISGVSDVVRLMYVDACEAVDGEGSSWVTTLAIKKDGSFYDLADPLKETGYY